mmetsp:Transcript_49227/g.124980  ORF Transcript_49227/g.124980 Transcript_49227/m.124980 type:complete len:110 (-) Transcript_49227:1382-1711(-)
MMVFLLLNFSAALHARWQQCRRQMSTLAWPAVLAAHHALLWSAAHALFGRARRQSARSHNEDEGGVLAKAVAAAVTHHRGPLAVVAVVVAMVVVPVVLVVTMSIAWLTR